MCSRTNFTQIISNSEVDQFDFFKSQMPEFKKIAVFCGASSGSDPVYIECARKLGEEMVRRNIGLVYGGGNVGLMGAIAETVGKGLGEDSVIGVIPKALAPREISGTTVGEIRLVEDMHTRKAMMFAEADAFIAIPGGFGTLDETLEITTWQQLVSKRYNIVKIIDFKVISFPRLSSNLRLEFFFLSLGIPYETSRYSQHLRFL